MTTRQIPEGAGTKALAPAVEGWFTLDQAAPALLGSRCTSCGTVAFPAEGAYCRNPACDGEDFAAIELSRRGRLWSFTDAQYQPPPPFVAAEPFEPFALAAVELSEEKIIVMGQMVPGVAVADLAVGDQVELVLDTLYEDESTRYLVWKWQPVSAGVESGTRP